MKKLAIVGAEPHTRDNAPWDDESFDIWLMNEWALEPWAKRYTATIDIHGEEIFIDPKNDRNGHNYFEWLKTSRGKPVYMQKIYPDIPDAVKYPLEEIEKEFLSTITFENRPVKSFRSSVSYCLALGLYLGYEQIDVYGVELNGTEHKGQASNFNFWVGIAAGLKVKMNLGCSRGSFMAPRYGFESFMKNSKADGYLEAMRVQLQDEQKKVLMLEGAVQLATQMLEEEMKDDIDVPE
jgi:hypothetical protein